MSAVTLVPIYVAAAIVVVFILVLFLIVVQDGRYAENLLRKAVRIRPLRRRMIQAYLRELEQSNPVAARAYSKMERVTGVSALKHTRAALSVLSLEERRAYLELFDDRHKEGLNRALRRHDAKSKRRKTGATSCAGDAAASMRAR